MYRTDRPLDTAQLAYEDLDKGMLLELRGSGGLTVVPPSTHKETGEKIVWESFTDPGQVNLYDLQRAAGELAAATLLSRYWPEKGSRDKAAMALTGGLVRAGWPTEKASPFVEAVAVAAGDEESRVRAGKAESTSRKLDDGKNVSGWPTLAKLLTGDGDAVVGRVRDWLGITTPATPADVIPEPVPWPDPPAEEAFHGLAGRIVNVIEPASEASRPALLVQALLGFGNVIERSAYFVVEADRHHANEFAVLVGRTSKARKGTSWGRIYRLYQEVEEQWAAERVQTGLSSGEGLIWAVRDPITKREKIKEDTEIVYVEVEADPGIEDKRLLIQEPEFANVLKQTERQGNTLSALLRQAWDGGNLRSMTKNSPARSTGAHISLIGHITADELRRYLTQTETANGYANRHLWICTDRSKQLPEGGHIDSRELNAVRDELIEAVAFARSLGNSAPRDDAHSMWKLTVPGSTNEVTRDDEARAIWREIYGPLSEGRPGLAGALVARAEAHVLRLSLIYALMDRSVVIRAPHLLAALALWDYCERSVYYVFGDELGDPVADDLLRLLRGCPDGLTRNDIMNYFGRNQSSNRISRGLGLLLQHQLARREPQATGGRPAERWFAVSRGQHSV
jgi:hypothetical protein